MVGRDVINRIVDSIFGEPEKVYAAGEGHLELAVIPAEAAFELTPTEVEIPLLACPVGMGMTIEVIGVGISFHTIPVDATNVATGDLEHVVAGTPSNIVAGFNYLAGITAGVYAEIFRGKILLEPGDTLRMENTITTPDTAGQGAAYYVVYRIKSQMAA